MFKVDITDDYGAVTNGYTSNSLDDILSDIRAEVLNGTSIESISLYKEIPLGFTIDVQVKDE
jgi:hypothetical protein